MIYICFFPLESLVSFMHYRTLYLRLIQFIFANKSILMYL